MTMLFSFLHLLITFFIIILAAFTTSIHHAAYAFSSNVTDQQALLSVKSSITGDSLGVLSSWNHSVHFCLWKGITCSHRHQRVTVLDLSHQQLEGELSPHIGNLSFLRKINLNTNNIKGSMPPEVAQLLRLEFLDLSINKLSGMVPLPLYNMSSISFIGLTQNHLEGTLPPDMGFTLPKLKLFFASGNEFLGPFPPSIANASNLVKFDIGSNNISGPIPLNLGTSLPNLQVLNMGDNPLGHNQLPGDLRFIESLINCTSLILLGLYADGLIGELPNSIVNFSTTLQRLDLFTNYIYGSIPQDIGKLEITQFGLSDNLLTGTIPESIGHLSKLRTLFLGANNISGDIPSSLSNITGLSTLNLALNNLTGSIPTKLFSISTLQHLDLFSNHLSGVIPKEIEGLSSQCISLSFNENLLTGPLPSNIGSLKHLTELYVSDNKLTGEIPASLGDCVMLEKLHMEGNLFEGRIPDSFKQLKSLQILDISSNNMFGNISTFLGGFRLIKFLNLSHNKLQGQVPQEGVFLNLSKFSVVGNLELCGGIQALNLPACPVKISRTKKKQFPLRMIPLVVLVPLAILLTCFVFLFYRFKRPTQKNIPMALLQDDQYPRLSYQDLLLATNEFSPNNLLGEGRYGSVYKGILEPLQQIVAVKVLNAQARGANKSFLAECETLRNIRHRNLIKIITACSSTDFRGNDFKALVFEFMKNGSLDNCLHPSPSDHGNERNLTLLQRLNIAIDLALAVDYLHNRCPTRIIHCDIKPSNILLDEEFVAHVGDFGLARFFSTTTASINQAQTSSTGVRGTVGYIPPEYGMGGEISAGGDVYSYGILLLEMFSGKRPTGSSISMENANNLHEYVKQALPQRLLEIADPRIILLEQEDRGLTRNESLSRVNITNRMEVCLASIFEVGVLCSVETPRDRMDIGVAVKQLHVAKDRLLNRGL